MRGAASTIPVTSLCTVELHESVLLQTLLLIVLKDLEQCSMVSKYRLRSYTATDSCANAQARIPPSNIHSTNIGLNPAEANHHV
jgi:hypothetical protein